MHDPCDPRPLWVTGAGGFLGSIVARCGFQQNLPILPLTRAHLDLLDPNAVQNFARKHPPLAIIHCAALSRSPECQSQPQRAYRANVQSVQHLIDAAPNTRLILLSTDLVFDGRKGNYAESDSVNPLSVYAETKVAAEILVSQFPNHLIVRTSLNFGFSPSGDRSFNEDMARAWQQGRTLPLFTDEYRCPIAALDTARFLLQLAQSEATGRLHIAGNDRLSRWQIGRALHEFYAENPLALPAFESPTPTDSSSAIAPLPRAFPPLAQAIVPSSLASYDGAPRPPDVSLNCSRASSLLGQPMPSFFDGLRSLAESIPTSTPSPFPAESPPPLPNVPPPSHQAPVAPYRGRIAPSPTGYLHLGHARTFWTAFQRAQAARGTLVFRDDDLDASRVRPEFQQAQFEDLRWLGIQWQEGPDVGGPQGPYRQSERLHLYKAAFEQLQNANAVYPCACSRKDILSAIQAPNLGDEEPIYPGRCRPHISSPPPQPPTRPVSWRFRVPDGDSIRFVDSQCGPQHFIAGRDFGDFVIWRPDQLPSYQLACVVDDSQHQITEVVRGADLLLSTARQWLIYRALNLAPPVFHHCPLLCDASGRRLAKRHDALSLRTLRETGMTPDRLRASNFLL